MCLALMLLMKVDCGMQVKLQVSSAISATSRKIYLYMRGISTSKFEAMVVRQKRVECSLWIGDEVLHQVEKLIFITVEHTKHKGL